MSTYVLGDIHITDPAAYQAHVPRALATIARFGGRVIAGGGGRVDLLEDDPIPERLFIIEFPTADAARQWYRSDDYQEVLTARLSASHSRVLLIEGSENIYRGSRARFGLRKRLSLAKHTSLAEDATPERCAGVYYPSEPGPRSSPCGSFPSRCARL